MHSKAPARLPLDPYSLLGGVADVKAYFFDPLL